MKKVLAIILTILITVTLVGCNKETVTTNEKDYVRPEDWTPAGNLIQKYTEENKEMPIVEMTYSFKDKDGYEYVGYMQYLLFPDLAPITVNNFLSLVEDGFYDGLIIHRIIEGISIQGGDPTQGPNADEDKLPLTIKGEFENNQFFNNLMHTRGVISMARIPSDLNSASSQFFIVTRNFSSCDGEYAAFGHLMTYDISQEERKVAKTEDGKTILYDYDALDKITEQEAKNEVPVNTIMIEKIVVVK